LDSASSDSPSSDSASLDSAVAAARERLGPVFVTVEVSTDPVPLVLPPRDGAHLAARFRRHLKLPVL
jgi:hypothetical protein